MPRFKVGLVLVLIISFLIFPVKVSFAFGLPDLGGLFNISAPSFSPAAGFGGFGGLGQLICQFVGFLCPAGSTNNPPNPASAPTQPNTGNRVSLPINIPGGLVGGGGVINPINFLGIAPDIVKKLWGDNPPPTWGGIGGSGALPIPKGSNKSTPAVASPGVIQSCVGVDENKCAYSCVNQIDACKARGCYCVKGGSGADCENFVKLSKNPQFGSALTECTGQVNTSTNNSLSGVSAGASGQLAGQSGGVVSQCTSDFGTCKSYCEANVQACQSRVAACRGGASGDDCKNTFLPGYEACCVQKSCTDPSYQNLVSTFCQTPRASTTSNSTNISSPLPTAPVQQPQPHGNSAASSPIQSCLGVSASGCAFSCVNNQDVCKARGCFCVSNPSVNDGDCDNFRELAKNPQFAAILSQCLNQPTNPTVQPRLIATAAPTARPTTASTDATNQEVGACAGGDFGSCQQYCVQNPTTCQARLRSCLAGAAGKDCDVFKGGYDYCCLQNQCSRPQDRPLVQAFCVSKVTTPLNVQTSPNLKSTAASTQPRSASTSQPASAMVQGCVGRTAINCAFACANQQDACKARGCYCVNNPKVSDGDCPQFRELAKNPQFKELLLQCGNVGQPVPVKSPVSVVSPTPASNIICQTVGLLCSGTPNANTKIRQCEGDFGSCQQFCTQNLDRCKQRVQACLGGAGGADCELFRGGVDYCCDKKLCTKPEDQALVQAFCSGLAPTPTLSPSVIIPEKIATRSSRLTASVSSPLKEATGSGMNTAAAKNLFPDNPYFSLLPKYSIEPVALADLKPPLKPGFWCRSLGWFCPRELQGRYLNVLCRWFRLFCPVIKEADLPKILPSPSPTNRSSTSPSILPTPSPSFISSTALQRIPIASCTNVTTTSCALSCFDKKEQCLERGCYCLKNNDVKDSDCTNFRTLAEDPRLKEMLTQCQ